MDIKGEEIQNTDLLLKFSTLALLVFQIDLLYSYAFEYLDSLLAPSGRLLTQPELFPRGPYKTKNGVANIGGVLCRLNLWEV
jgi:hypothetical protein